jgi:hypothetical protein
MGSRCYECGDSGCACSRCHANPDRDPESRCSCPRPWELLEELTSALSGVGIDGTVDGRDRWYGSLWAPVHDGVAAARAALAERDVDTDADADAAGPAGHPGTDGRT